jgi:two-component system, sensor histidine kinase
MLNILIVDDNKLNCDAARTMLEHDYAVATTKDGLEALTALACRKFDIILMDVGMPVLDGLSTTAVIRAFEKGTPSPVELSATLSKGLAVQLAGGHVLIVAMAAHPASADNKKCLSTGMDGYIAKPLQPEVLVSVLQSLIVASPSPCSRKDTSPVGDRSCPPVAVSLPAAKVEQVVSHFRSVMLFSNEQIVRLLSLSRKSVTKNLGIAEKEWKESDFEAFGIAVHTLKGTLLQCGLVDWAEKAQEIHEGIRNNQELPYADLFETLKNGLSELLEEQVEENRTNLV